MSEDTAVKSTPPTQAVQKRPQLERSLVAKMAERYGMDSGAFHATIKATLMPQNTSNEAVAAFLVVADRYGLNPFTREIFAFPDTKSGGIRPIVSIDGWSKLVNDHQQCNGFELVEIFTDDMTFLAVEARFHRKDREHPVVLREYLVECDRNTEPWKRWPRRMLRHKAFIQGARLAFGFSGIEDEDEYERTIEVQGATVHRAPQTAKESRTIDLMAAKPAEPRDPPGGSSMGDAKRPDPEPTTATTTPAGAPTQAEMDAADAKASAKAAEAKKASQKEAFDEPGSRG